MPEKNLILYADDDKLIRLLTEELLLDFGYDILTASNGDEAFKLFKHNKNSINLAILDIFMPSMDGIESAKEIQNIDDQLPVIFTTGKDLKTYTERLSEINNYTVLPKPYSPKRLISEITKLNN